MAQFEWYRGLYPSQSLLWGGFLFIGKKNKKTEAEMIEKELFEVGARIKELRESAGMSEEEAALRSTDSLKEYKLL